MCGIHTAMCSGVQTAPLDCLHSIYLPNNENSGLSFNFLKVSFTVA